MFYDYLIQPFIEFGFMRRALVSCLALSISAGPIGVFLVLRRMSLMGDAMSHAILPGAAIGFLVFGLSMWAMSLGGLVVALVVALAAGAMSRVTPLKEDAALAGFFLISLALGVLLVSMKGSSVDLLHILFGTLLAVSNGALLLIAAAGSLQLAASARARARFSSLKVWGVGPQATSSRAISKASGNSRFTCSRSCKAAITVRPSLCQVRTTCIRSEVVF